MRFMRKSKIAAVFVAVCMVFAMMPACTGTALAETDSGKTKVDIVMGSEGALQETANTDDAEKVWSLVLWDADQGYWYAKRFLLNASLKPQSFLGENPQSKMLLLNDREQATFLIHFADEARADLTVLMSEFIAVKGPAARGKRLTTYEVASIEDITPIPEPEQTPSIPLEGE